MRHFLRQFQPDHLQSLTAKCFPCSHQYHPGQLQRWRWPVRLHLLRGAFLPAELHLLLRVQAAVHAGQQLHGCEGQPGAVRRSQRPRWGWMESPNWAAELAEGPNVWSWSLAAKLYHRFKSFNLVLSLDSTKKTVPERILADFQTWKKKKVLPKSVIRWFPAKLLLFLALKERESELLVRGKVRRMGFNCVIWTGRCSCNVMLSAAITLN